MTLVHPVPALRGSVRVPSSKPHCQRAFLFAALAEGRSRIRRLNTCTETNLVADACVEFGGALTYDGDTVTVDGVAGRPRRPAAVLRTAGSGFALRNLLAISALAPGPSIFAGDSRLGHRPLAPLVDCLQQLGSRVESLDPGSALPIVSWGGGIHGGAVDVPADETSQFVTALLLVAPYADDVVRLRLPEPIVGHHYIAMTIAMMRDFGATVDASDDLTEITVRPGGYTGRDTCIGPDATSLFYFVGAAVVTDVDLRIDDVRLGIDPFLDSAIELGRALGARITPDGDGVRIRSGEPPAAQVVVDATDVPTLVPALAAIAPSLPAGMRLTGADHLRHHKTSRLDVLMSELETLGRRLAPIYVDGALDGFVSAGMGRPSGDRVDSHGDHRLFMALYLASLATDQVTRLRGHETLVTSFSDFLECFDTLRASAPSAAPAGWAPAQDHRSDFDLTTTEATA
jgi:3-phosphoshikimate 1-carboxyvinyltransferase